MNKAIIEEVSMRRKTESLNKEAYSERIKSMLLAKKRRRNLNEYISVDKLVKNNRERQKSYAYFKRSVKKRSTIDESVNRPLIAIRICGEKQRIAKEIKDVLHKLGLFRLFSCAFLKNDPVTREALKIVNSYVTYGFVSQENIHEILIRRGKLLEEGKDVRNLDNEAIEAALGSKNILCFEDLVHEITTIGKHFNEVVNFVGNIWLRPSEEVKTKVNKEFSKAGSQGNRGEAINELLRNMI